LWAENIRNLVHELRLVEAKQPSNPSHPICTTYGVVQRVGAVRVETLTATHRAALRSSTASLVDADLVRPEASASEEEGV
jgi:hypothetical protein